MKRKPIVLVVDDDPRLRRSLRKELEHQGYTVLEASSGHQALQGLPHHLDLVVLDFNMPGLSGGEVLARIRAVNPSLPVIMFSSAVENPDAAELLLELGATRLVSKPDVDVLVRAVAELVPR